jgi:hypothetical protein
MTTRANPLAAPKMIGKRTKEGDRVFDGLAVFNVLHRIGEMLVLQPEGGDYHFYVRSIEGGTRRFTEYQAALNAACLPAVASSVVIARAGGLS